MRASFRYNPTVVAAAMGAIVVSTVILSYFSYYYTVGRASLVDLSLVQSNMRLAAYYIDSIERRIIDNDRIMSDMVDVDNPSSWPETVEEIRRGDFNVEQVYFLRLGDTVPIYPPYSNEIRNAWGAFRASFRPGELNLERLGLNQAHHLHKERQEKYYFASYVLKEDAAGKRILICFQFSFEKIIALIDKTLRDLQPGFYVSIVDFDNNGVYSQPIARSSKYFYETRFPTTLYKWLLQIVPRNYTEIEREARNQRRMNLFLILLSMTLIFCSLVIIYVAGRRERQLAQMKEDFISKVSHELKTPLSLIRMFSEMLVTGRVRSQETRKEYYGIIHNESDRMGRLVNNLLDFARLEREKQGARLETTDIAALVRRELEAYRQQAGESGFRIVTAVEPGIPETQADPNAITTAFFNLLDNAVKYSGESREVLVDVAVDNGFIALSVTDRGVGIPPGEHEKVFEKFYRGSSAAGGRIRGSGIGLSITKHVAEMHGGEVTVDSEPGRGSRFTLRIPIVKAPAEKSQG